MNRIWYEIKNAASKNETEILLYGEIGSLGVSALRFVNDLKYVPRANRIILRIHSPGGGVFDGQAICSALKGHPGGVTTQIDGYALSMASVVAMTGSPARMACNAMFMIHNVSGVAGGDAAEIKRIANFIEKVNETLVAAYVARTGIERERIVKMMDDETWMNAQEAQEHGFIDEITGGQKMTASFDLSGFLHPPAQAEQSIRAQFEAILDQDEQFEFYRAHRHELLVAQSDPDNSREAPGPLPEWEKEDAPEESKTIAEQFLAIEDEDERFEFYKKNRQQLLRHEELLRHDQ